MNTIKVSCPLFLPIDFFVIRAYYNQELMNEPFCQPLFQLIIGKNSDRKKEPHR